VASIRVGERELDHAVAGESVLVGLEDEVDISRGDLIALAGDSAPTPRATFDATVCWLGQRALEPRREYLLRQGTRETRVRIRRINAHLDIQTLAWVTGGEPLEPNGIAQLSVSTQHPIVADSYETLRATGSFILIDATTFDTVAAGMIS
jgi:sulfate adenylyltransferase subunit 1